jgi:hypothetical protein
MSKRFWEVTAALFDWVTFIVLIFAIPLLLAWAIDPVRVWLEESGHVSERSVTAVSALTVISAIVGLRALARMLGSLTVRVEMLQERLTALQPWRGDVGPTNRAQAFVMDHFQSTREPHDKEIYLLAQNLVGSLPLVFPLLQDAKVSGWKLHIYCVDPDATIEGMTPDWRGVAREMSGMLARNLVSLASDLSARNVSVDLTYYRHLPVVHGLLFASGSLVVTIAHWTDEGVLADTDTYDFVEADDFSRHADARRQLLQNWIDAAHTRGRAAIVGNKVLPGSPLAPTTNVA